MSNAIQFLAGLGSKAALSPSDYAAAVGALDVEDTLQKQALLDRDHVALNEMLDGRVQMLCLILSPDDQPVRKEEEQPAEEPSEDFPSDPE